MAFAAVLTMGTFDTLHPGHLELLRVCKRMTGAGGLVVAVNTDDFVKRYKGRPPAMTTAERVAVLSACRYVDEVVENDGAGQAALIKRVGAPILAVGVEWARKDYAAQLDVAPEWFARSGVTVVYVQHGLSAAVSTTAIRERVAGDA